MREDGCGPRKEEEEGCEGSRRASMVGSASWKVARGSRQAPPWTKLVVVCAFCQLGAVGGKVVGDWKTYTSQYLGFPAGSAGILDSSSGNSQTATFWRAFSVL